MEERFWYLFTRYLSKESSLKENEELKDIISGDPKYRQLFEENSYLWNINKRIRVDRFDAERIRRKVLQHVDAKPHTPSKSYRVYWRLAAVFILFITFGAYFYFATKTEQAPAEEVMLSKVTADTKRAMFTLSDGTQVWLRENSKITYPESFASEGVRCLQLEGEAYFNVAKNETMPFIVRTGEISTRVLGTQFNVRAFPENDIEITVESGKVLVESKFKGISLEPDEQVLIDRENSEMSKARVNAKNISVWKEPEIIFDMVSLQEAFTIMERYYNVDIVADSRIDLSCKVRARYENESLETVLQGLKLIFDFDYKVAEGEKIMICGGGC